MYRVSLAVIYIATGRMVEWGEEWGGGAGFIGLKQTSNKA